MSIMYFLSYELENRKNGTRMRDVQRWQSSIFLSGQWVGSLEKTMEKNNNILHNVYTRGFQTIFAIKSFQAWRHCQLFS